MKEAEAWNCVSLLIIHLEDLELALRCKSNLSLVLFPKGCSFFFAFFPLLPLAFWTRRLCWHLIPRSFQILLSRAWLSELFLPFLTHEEILFILWASVLTRICTQAHAHSSYTHMKLEQSFIKWWLPPWSLRGYFLSCSLVLAQTRAHIHTWLWLTTKLNLWPRTPVVERCWPRVSSAPQNF